MGDIGFWLLISIGIVVGILLLIAAFGMTLPRTHQVARSITLKQTPDTVWQTITDFANVTTWNENVLKMEKQPDKNGHELWKETYKGNYGLFLETTEATPPIRLVRTIADEKGPFTGRWEFALTPTEVGCKLTITEFGEVGNPFFRVMFRLFMKPEVYVEMYLTAFAKKFGEQPVYV
ncbi:MAG: SRPBCC family protein [Gemmataceae bacterium]|nr:SRPBCC family protein [Gemmataceae bacterium]